MGFTDIYETIRKQQKTISSKVHMEHFPGEDTSLATQKKSLSKVRKFEIIRTFFSKHSAMGIDINYKKK